MLIETELELAYGKTSMEETIREITAQLVKTEGVARESVNELGRKFGVSLPSDYIDFMMHTNGATGFVGQNSFLQLWSVEEVAELNDGTDDVRDEHPEWLFFAGMGGGSWYAFDRDMSRCPSSK